MKFLGVIFSLLIALSMTSVGAQTTPEPEMWGYGNLSTGEIAVVMLIDMESSSTAEMIHNDFAEILVDDVLLPGYEEIQVTSLPKRGKIDLVPDGSECRLFVGETEALEGEGTLIMCRDGSEIFVVFGDASDSVMWGFADDFYEDGKPSTPNGFLDLTDQLD